MPVGETTAARTSDGIARAEANADEAWKESALQIVANVATVKKLFSVLDVWRRFVEIHGEFAHGGTKHLCAMGAVMRRAAGAKLIEPTHMYVVGPAGGAGRRGHSKAMPLWQSLIYRGES